MKTPSSEHTLILNSLKRAVSKELERKRRLGHYAVLWKNGRPVFTEGDRPVTKPEFSSVREEPPPYPESSEHESGNSEHKGRESKHQDE